MPTLPRDCIYYLGVVQENAGYNQRPHTGYFLGEGTKLPVGSALP